MKLYHTYYLHYMYTPLGAVRLNTEEEQELYELALKIGYADLRGDNHGGIMTVRIPYDEKPFYSVFLSFLKKTNSGR